jgi:hypothetical protein
MSASRRDFKPNRVRSNIIEMQAREYNRISAKATKWLLIPENRTVALMEP